MAVYVVAYDLRGPETRESYKRLIEAITTAPHCHAQKSLWFVEHDGPATTIRTVLQQYLDTNDILFVDEISAAWAGFGMPKCGAWLNARGR